MVELKEGRPLAMLFVDPACQGQASACPVRSRAAAPAHTGADRARLAQRSATYLRYGFVLDGDVGEFNGLVYQQMVRAAA